MEIVSLCFDPSGSIIFMASGPCLWAWAYLVPHSSPHQLLVQPPGLRCVACPAYGGRLITGSANANTGPNARHGINGRMEPTFRLVAWSVDFDDLHKRLETSDEPAMAIGPTPSLLASSAVLYNDGGIGFSPWGDRAVLVTFSNQESDNIQSENELDVATEPGTSESVSRNNTDRTPREMAGTPTSGVSSQMETVALANSPERTPVQLRPMPHIPLPINLTPSAASESSAAIGNRGPPRSIRDASADRSLTPPPVARSAPSRFGGVNLPGSPLGKRTSRGPPALIRPGAGTSRRQRENNGMASLSIDGNSASNPTASLNGGSGVSNGSIVEKISPPPLVRPMERMFDTRRTGSTNSGTSTFMAVQRLSSNGETRSNAESQRNVTSSSGVNARGVGSSSEMNARGTDSRISHGDSNMSNRVSVASRGSNGTMPRSTVGTTTGRYSIALLSLVGGHEGDVIRCIPLHNSLAKGVTSIKVRLFHCCTPMSDFQAGIDTCQLLW
jgi:hypothetical protein